MAAHLSAVFLRSGLALFLLLSAPYARARHQATVTPSPQTTYVYFQRARRHEKFSTPEVFQQVVNEIHEYLSANRVVALTEGNGLSVGTELPLSAVQEMARDSGAAYLLYAVVDRPRFKWLKVTVQCFDTSGQEVWREEASAGGGLTGGTAPHDTLQKLRDELNLRLGQPGLQQRASAQKQAPSVSSSDQKSVSTESISEARPLVTASETQPAPPVDLEGSGATVRLANGTPVHLLLVESVSSKSAQQGGPVKLQVLGDVKVGNLVVIANKAPATAIVETAQGAGRAWRRGSLLLKLGTVTLLNEQQQPLRAWNAVLGKDTEAAADWTNAVLQSYGFALLFLPFAPLQHGNEAVMHQGTVLEAVINGDILLSRAAIEASQPVPAQRRHGPASVTFYYPDFAEGNSVGVWCGQVKVGLLKRGGKFTLILPPGRYWLRTWNSRRSPIAELVVEDGDEQYVRAIPTSHRTGLDVTWQEHFAVVPHDVGEVQSAETSSAKSPNVQDPSKLDLALLQSDPRVKQRK
jgi:hypothetical protein